MLLRNDNYFTTLNYIFRFFLALTNVVKYVTPPSPTGEEWSL